MSGSVGDNPYRASGVIAAAAGGGGVSWQSVVTASTFTAEAGNGYPVNTTSNACTVTLPAAASVGDQIIFTDYARNWGTNALTINPNSLNYQGNTTPQPVYNTAGESIHIVYMDTTKGWIPTYDGAVALETPQTYNFDYLVVAGGGGGGDATINSGHSAGGGGAGGYKTGTSSTVDTGNVITCDVGGGGAIGADGEDSSISGTSLTTVTSTGGGAGGDSGNGPTSPGDDGGSGGGGGGETVAPGGSGTGSQGHAGGSGTSVSSTSSGGGGGAGAVGANQTTDNGGDGGVGVSNSITGSAVYYAGGGGGGAGHGTTDGDSAGDGGNGGGGNGSYKSTPVAEAGDANTGGGGGGASGGDTSGVGGTGVIILKIADSNYSGTTSGTVSIDTSSVTDYTILKYTGDGTYTT